MEEFKKMLTDNSGITEVCFLEYLSPEANEGYKVDLSSENWQHGTF